jgi:hypothetical protein
LSGLIQAISGVVQFVSGAFTGDWKRAWEGIKNIFWGIVKSLKNMFGDYINSAIDEINKLIDAVNKVTSKVGISIPKVGKIALDYTQKMLPGNEMRYGGTIPQFAAGGIVTEPTLAMIGEGSEAEAILPLSKLDKYAGRKGNTIHINVTGNHIANDYDVERIANTIVKRLRFEGVY